MPGSHACSRMRSVYTKPEAITAQRFPQVAFAVIARSEATTQSITVASTLWISSLRGLRNMKCRIFSDSFITEGGVACGCGLSTNSDLRWKSGLAPPRMRRRRLEALDGCQACKWPTWYG